MPQTTAFPLEQAIDIAKATWVETRRCATPLTARVAHP